MKHRYVEPTVHDAQNIIDTLNADAPLSWHEAEEKIDKIWRDKTEQREMLSQFVWMDREDFLILKQNTWLNDAIINAFILLCKTWCDKNKKKIYFFLTYFYTVYKNNQCNHASVENWTKKIDLFTMDKIIVPIHLGYHWALAVINVEKKRFEYRDSLLQTGTAILQNLAKYMYEEHRKQHKQELDLSGWKTLIFKAGEIAEQDESNACGIYVCEYIRAVVQDKEYNTTLQTSQHPEIRRRLACEILTRQMLPHSDQAKLKEALQGMSKEALVAFVENLQKHRSSDKMVSMMKLRANELLGTKLFDDKVLETLKI